jgi:subtilisin family serine protease
MLPDRVYAHASPLSAGGQSMFAQAATVRRSTVTSFASHPTIARTAAQRLADVGFEILQVTPLTINIAGTPDQFEKTFRTKLVTREVQQPIGRAATFIDSADAKMLGLINTFGTPLGNIVEGVALEAPRRLFAESVTAPRVDYWHLDVPADVASACNATALHRLQVTGRGVRVAMVDSGWYRHAFFTGQGYKVAPVVVAPGASAPESDESGHGTGESANIMAIAPDCELLPVKANFANTIAAFNEAVTLAPDIITCSWGSHIPFALGAADVALAASVAAAVAGGITVIFSAGNGHAGFPGQHPDVISAGGVFIGPDGSMMASDYASGFQSNIYPGRRVPDLCGLVGMRPKAIYIMLPVEPAAAIDVDNSGSVFPDGDQTAADDGWAAFSGTSAAAPQLAGAAALIKQVNPAAMPSQVKAALMETARDVAAGNCSVVPDMHGGLPATPGPDDATGVGLVDVTSAVIYAYLTSIYAYMTAIYGAPQSAAAFAASDADLLAADSAAVAAYYQGLSDALTLACTNPIMAAYLYGSMSGVGAPH